MENKNSANIKITISTIEKRKGLIGKIFPKKEVLQRVINFGELPYELKQKARIYEVYIEESRKLKKSNPAHSTELHLSARDKAFEITELFCADYIRENSDLSGIIGKFRYNSPNNFKNELFIKLDSA